MGVVGEVSTAWLEPSYKPAVFFAAIIVLLLVRAERVVWTEQELVGSG